MMTSSATASLGRRKMLFLAATIAAIAVFAAFVVFRAAVGPWAIPIAMGAFALAFAFSLGYFAALDELAQRAQYLAWFWGACSGLIVFIFAMVIAGFPGSAWIALVDSATKRAWGVANATTGFSGGVIVVLLAQLAGAVLWWLGYWVRKR